MSHVMRKPVFFICEQQRCRSAVRFLDSIISILAKSKISRPSLASVAEQAGLSLTWSQPRRQVFSWRGLYTLYTPCHTPIHSVAQGLLENHSLKPQISPLGNPEFENLRDKPHSKTYSSILLVLCNAIMKIWTVSISKCTQMFYPFPRNPFI